MSPCLGGVLHLPAAACLWGGGKKAGAGSSLVLHVDLTHRRNCLLAMPNGGRDGHFCVLLLWVLLYTTRPSSQLGTGPLTKQKSELGWVGTLLWDQWFSGSSRHIHWRNPPHCIPLPSSTPDPHPFSRPRPLSEVERKHLMCLQQGGWDRPSVQLRPKEASWLLTGGRGWTWGWRGQFCHSGDARWVWSWLLLSL